LNLEKRTTLKKQLKMNFNFLFDKTQFQKYT